MDKLCCDICGGILTMQPGGKTVVCDSCGMQYGVERLREKVQEIKGIVSVEGTVRTQNADFIIRGGVLEQYNGNDTHVAIPDSVVKIGDNAFKGCLGIKSVAFPDHLKEIGKWSFYDCRSLKQITLPETVKAIGDWAFMGCTSLETINIPDQLEGGYKRLCGTFANCPALREVIISEKQKEKLFIYRGSRWISSYAEDIFEELIDIDDDIAHSCQNCGPWYLSFKRQLEAEKEAKELKRLQAERRAENKCLHCGGFFTGIFTKKCAKCGKPKDY